jgi:hypothetical protein
MPRTALCQHRRATRKWAQSTPAHLLLHLPQLLRHLHALALQLVHLGLLPHRRRRQHGPCRGQRRFLRWPFLGRCLLLLGMGRELLLPYCHCRVPRCC